MDEARVEDTKYGRGPVSDGWFVVNVRDAAWMHSPKFGSACVIETDDVVFPKVVTALHLDEVERLISWVFQPVGCARWDVRRFPRA